MISAELLYRGSKNGWNMKDFHMRCDQKGPTLLIGGTKAGRIIGGFTTVSWHSHNSMPDPRSFIFFMVNGVNQKHANIPITAEPFNLPGTYLGIAFGIDGASMNIHKKSQYDMGNVGLYRSGTAFE